MTLHGRGVRTWRSLNQMQNLRRRMWFSLVVSFFVLGIAVFLSAGTLRYWQGWMYLGVGVVSSTPLTLYIVNDPILLENRSKLGPTAEKRVFQKIVVLVVGLFGVATFVVPGLDHRFGWSRVPAWLSVAGALLILLSMWMVYRVFRENSYGSATVEIGMDQKVISTGPYAIVRNPMYSSGAVYFVGTPLSLGSYWGLVPAGLTILGIILRLFDEEKFLADGLPGYREYCARVRWHLIPGIF